MPRMTIERECKRERVENSLIGLRHALDDLAIIEILMRQRGVKDAEKHIEHIRQLTETARKTLVNIWREEDWNNEKSPASTRDFRENRDRR
jgi:hypothetical protein